MHKQGGYIGSRCRIRTCDPSAPNGVLYQTELNAIINSGSVNLLRTLRPGILKKVPELYRKALPPTLFKGSVFFLSGNLWNK